MKQFVKALATEEDYFNYLIKEFPDLSSEKIKASIFDDLQIWKLNKMLSGNMSINLNIV